MNLSNFQLKLKLCNDLVKKCDYCLKRMSFAFSEDLPTRADSLSYYGRHQMHYWTPIADTAISKD